MLPNPLEEIARKLDEYNKRLSHLERLEGGGRGLVFTVSPSGFQAWSGAAFGQAPSIQVAAGWDAIVFSAGATEHASTTFFIPAGITAIVCDYYFCLDGNDNAQISIQYNSTYKTVGEDTDDAGDEEAPLINMVPPGAQWEIFTMQRALDPTQWDPGDLSALTHRRRGATADDNNTDDLYFLGMHVTMS